MQVFENEHQGFACCDVQQQRGHGVHEPESRLLGLESRPGGARHQLRDQFRDRRNQVRLLMEYSTRAFARRQRTQDLYPGPVHGSAASLPCESPVDGRVPRSVFGSKFGEQTALANTGLAGDEAKRAAAAASRVERTGEGGEFARPPDECAAPASCWLCVQVRTPVGKGC